MVSLFAFHWHFVTRNLQLRNSPPENVLVLLETGIWPRPWYSLPVAPARSFLLTAQQNMWKWREKWTRNWAQPVFPNEFWRFHSGQDSCNSVVRYQLSAFSGHTPTLKMEAVYFSETLSPSITVSWKWRLYIYYKTLVSTYRSQSRRRKQCVLPSISCRG